MARAHNTISCINDSSGMSEHDTDTHESYVNEDIMKLFDSDEDLGFSGFSNPESAVHNTAPEVLESGNGEGHSEQNTRGSPKRNKKQKKSSQKNPGKSKKGKAPLKRSQKQVMNPDEPGPSHRNEDSFVVVDQEAPPKKRGRRATAAIGDDHSTNKASDRTIEDTLGNLFQTFSDNIISAITQKSRDLNATQSVSQNEIESNGDVQLDNTCNNVDNSNLQHDSDINMFSMSESDSETEHDFEFEMPKIFEDDERFGDEINTNIASIVEKVCLKRSDVSSLVSDLKIPINCKSLAPPQVNPEIWQFLERRAKSEDLHFQTIQRLLAFGIVPILHVAQNLRTKNQQLDVKNMRESVKKSLTILTNVHFEISIRRRMSLKPHIDRRYYQLCTRNEPIGSKLFGDDVSKRLRDINEVQKLNKTFVGSKNLRGRAAYRRTGFRWERGQYPNMYRNSNMYQRRMISQPRNCRQQFFNQKKKM